MSEMDMNLPLEEEEDNIITMLGDDGEEVNFEFLDLIEYEGKEDCIDGMTKGLKFLRIIM